MQPGTGRPVASAPMPDETLPTLPAAAAPSATDWLFAPRASERQGKLLVHYARGVAVAWIALAVVGLVFGYSVDQTEGGIIGLAMTAICTFVAWFALRPVVVADHTGMAILPVFGSRTAVAWHEIRAIGVRRVRAARGRGEALMIDLSDDREVKVDGLWVGLTAGNLLRIQDLIEAYVVRIDVARPRFGPAPDADLEADRW